MLTLIVAGPVIGLAGTDLVLPAIPTLHEDLPGTLSSSQLVLAAFTAGAGLGLLCFGELGARYSQYRLLLIGLLFYGLFSYIATLAPSIMSLSGVRFFQGFAASAPAVFAPGMIRRLFDERGAMRAMGLVGSIESMVPAFAPILGAWMITRYHWQATFYLTALLSALLLMLWLFNRPPVAKQAPRAEQGYLYLLRSGRFMRYALSHAFALGGLIAFVFGAPTIMVHSMGGSLSDFIIMQISGITLFAVAANSAHLIVDRIGQERTLFLGSGLAATGMFCLLLYGLWFDDHVPAMVWPLFAIVNLGIGIRGPGGFYMAMVASNHNDARATAVLVLTMFALTAAITALVAPFINQGLVPLTTACSAACCCSLLVMSMIPGLPDQSQVASLDE